MAGGREAVGDHTRKRILITIVLGILLSLIYVAIFQFSDQDAEESSSLSMEVTEKCVETITELTGRETDVSLQHMLAVKYEKCVRKAAHFVEYTLAGAVICMILMLWFVKNAGRLCWNTVWIVLSASFDELHQYFVPGRYSSPLDVMIDTAGGLCGVGIVLLSAHMTRKKEATRKTVKSPLAGIANR